MPLNVTTCDVCQQPIGSLNSLETLSMKRWSKSMTALTSQSLIFPYVASAVTLFRFQSAIAVCSDLLSAKA